MSHTIKITICWLILLLTATVAAAEIDYDALAADIRQRLDNGAEQYRKGNIEAGKNSVQMAYFEVFENLEGPIRINTSAKLSFELEKQFGDIRAMMTDGRRPAEIEAAVNTLNQGIAEAIVQVKETGHTVVGGPELVNIDVAAIDPVWLEAYQTTEKHLKNVLDAYYRGSYTEADEMLKKAQYDGYKNTLLETGIRRGISAQRDYHYNSTFSDIKKMMENGESDEAVAERINTFLGELLGDTQGLPMVDLALSDQQKKNRKEATTPEKNWRSVTEELMTAIDGALVNYSAGKVDDAKIAVQNSYFDIFEASGMEQRVGIRDTNLKLELEGYFTRLVAQMKAGLPVGDLQKTATEMNDRFTTVALEMANDREPSFLETLLLSLFIIVREGFEAILVITAIIAYMVKTGNENKLRTVYSGALWAIVLSAATAYILKGVLDISGAGQELLEGATMLLAVVVLFFVSHWLIAKAETSRWEKYIKDKMGESLSRGSLWGLWFAVFLAVYREGAETILFYSALFAQSSGSTSNIAIGTGFISGSMLLVVIYLVMRFTSVKLPLRQFFLFTGGLLYLMAFVFAGKAMMEFVEGKLFEPTLLPAIPQINLLGIFPYVETLAPQITLILLFIAGLFYGRRNGGKVSERP